MLLVAISELKGPEAGFAEYCGIACDDHAWVYSATNGSDSITVSIHDVDVRPNDKLQGLGFVLINQEVVGKEIVGQLIDGFRQTRCIIWLHYSANLADGSIEGIFSNLMGPPIEFTHDGTTPVEKFMINVATGGNYEEEYSHLLSHSMVKLSSKSFSYFYPLWIDVTAVRLLNKRGLSAELYIRDLSINACNNYYEIAIKLLSDYIAKSKSGLPLQRSYLLDQLVAEDNIVNDILESIRCKPMTKADIKKPVPAIADGAYLNVICTCRDDNQFTSLKRAFIFLYNIKLSNAANKKMSNNDIMMYAVADENFSSWIWNEVRSIKKALNPVIVFGYDDENTFLLNNPVFKSYAEEHTYFQIPYDFDEVFLAMTSLKPVYDNLTRKIMITDYSSFYEHKLVAHDFKIIKNDKEHTIRNMMNVLNYYIASGADNKAAIIKEAIMSIRTSDNWIQLAESAKQCLIDKLKEK